MGMGEFQITGEGGIIGVGIEGKRPHPLEIIMLRYNGKGFIVGIPARDLTADEVKKYGGIKFLLSTGLYTKSKAKKEIKIVVEEGNDGRIKST